jgi:hypothetical protein
MTKWIVETSGRKHQKSLAQKESADSTKNEIQKDVTSDGDGEAEKENKGSGE